jgi:RNA polymerase sigma factor (sigma-70 family)
LSHIYANNYNLLFDYGHRFTANVQIVEDAIQDVYINLMKYRKSIGYVKNVQGYLVSTFRRQIILDINKQNKTISTEQMPDGFFDYFKVSDTDGNDKAEKEFLYATIEKCINKLTDKQKEIIFLKFEKELSYEDIAMILNISVESCYKSIYRAIKLIRCSAQKIVGNSNDLNVGISSDLAVIQMSEFAN